MSELLQKAQEALDGLGPSNMYDDYDQATQWAGLVRQLKAEVEQLRRWQRKVVDALGVSEGPGMETGGVWFCADADDAVAHAHEAVTALQEELER